MWPTVIMTRIRHHPFTDSFYTSHSMNSVLRVKAAAAAFTTSRRQFIGRTLCTLTLWRCCFSKLLLLVLVLRNQKSDASTFKLFPNSNWHWLFANICPTNLDKFMKINNQLFRKVLNKHFRNPLFTPLHNFKTLPVTLLHISTTASSIQSTEIPIFITSSL